MDKNISSENGNNKSRNSLAIIALLCILPPLFFWLTVLLKFGGGIDVLFRFWNYLPEFLLKPIIFLLPVPALVLGVFALWQIRKRRAKGVGLSLATVILSVAFIILCVLAAFRPG